jgi:viroplasmin and RNaseH domain-containing protein
MNRIDSLSKFIDKKNPKISTFSIYPDSIIGEKVISVKEQHFKKISKYVIQTNKTGNRMDMKYAILYLYQDTLIKATIFYNEDKRLWENFYYKDNVYFYGMLSARGMRFSPDGNDKKFIAYADWLIANKFRK